MADTEGASGGAQPASSGKGKGLWAPTRGYFQIAGGATRAAAPKKAAPKKPAGGAVLADAVLAASAGPALESAAAATAAKPSAATKAAARPKEVAAKAGAPVAPKRDPERDSVTTVPGLAETALGKTLADQLYDPPDSETTLYKVPSLNVLFALTSALLLFVTLLVVWQDYSRPWKTIQSDWNNELASNYEKDFEKERAAEQAELAKLDPELVSIYRKVLGQEAPAGVPGSPERAQGLVDRVRTTLEKSPVYAEYKTKKRDADDKKTKHLLADQGLRAFRGDFQAAKHLLDEAKRHILDAKGDTEESLREILELQKKFAEEYLLRLERLEGEVEVLLGESKAAADALADFEKTSTRVTAAAEGVKEVSLPAFAAAFDAIARKVKDARKKVELVESSWRNFVRNMPFFDFMAPSYKIEKVVLKDLHEDLNFETVPRVERCKTCHLNIESPEAGVVGYRSEKWGGVYASHPRLDLFVGSASPHPYEKFGCTPCHQGDGHATDFITAAHTPDDEKQGEEWEKKYEWKPLHHQDFPMLQKKYLTGICMKCHPADHELDGGGSWNLGYEVIKTYGCFGCHNISVYRGGSGDIPVFKGLEKVGPTLTHLGDKADLAWVYKWIRNPKHFRPSTRMPRFFDLTNSRGRMIAHDNQGEKAATYELDFDVRNGVEALALATYLSTTSEPRADLFQLTADGDAARGREIFQQTGCLGCHSVKRESNTGEKLGENLADLVAKASEGLDAAVAALPRDKEDLKKKAAQAGEAAASAKAALAALLRFYEALPVGRNVEALYHEVVVSLDQVVKVEESLGADGGPVAQAKAAGKAIYDRWIHNSFAPDLSSIGSKVKSPDWLADWIVDPRKHDPKTLMPRFRLETNQQTGERDEAGMQQVADMVAYLMTLRDPEFDKSEVFSMESQEARDMLEEIAFDYRRRAVSRTLAQAELATWSQEKKLQFVGHRLVRRYGCFGCHHGIKDTDFDAKPGAEKDAAPAPASKTFDAAQPIGTDLTGWGWKMPAFLDYGNWGHQHSDREAIGHNRYDWAHAKLTDTRRFDVIPAEKVAGKGKYDYSPTNQLIQKTPEELLKMPRFGFADDETQVNAVVTFLAGLGKDRIPLEKTRTLTGPEKTLEDGSRLIARLNCQGCHRIGAETRSVPIAKLPKFSLYGSGDEDDRRGELEKETWLARDTRLMAYPPESKGLDKAQAGITIPKGTLLRQQVFDTTTMAYDKEKMEPAGDDPVSVVELASGSANPESKLKGHFAALQVPEEERQLLVAGFEEGRIRFHFGGGDPKGGVEGRPLAPPPLVREGERVRSEWLFKFLLHVQPIRSWLKVRMPSFYLTDDEARLLVAWFKANAAGVPEAYESFAEDTLQRDLVAKGLALFGPTVGQRVGLQCNSCHPAGEKLPTVPTFIPESKLDYKKFGFEVPDEKYYVVWKEGQSFGRQLGFADAASADAWAKQNVSRKEYAVGEPWSKIKWGPDLGKAAERLRPVWIRDWLVEPWDFMPITNMPHFFGERHSIQGVVPLKDPEKLENINSLIQYLVHMKTIEAVAKTAGD